MAKHRFDGDWKYFKGVSSTGVPVRDGSMTFKMPDQSGKLDKGSKHKKADDLTGQVTADAIEMWEQDAGVKIHFRGRLIIDLPGQLVIFGRWDDESGPIRSKGEKLTQDDGTWVITKP